MQLRLIGQRFCCKWKACSSHNKLGNCENLVTSTNLLNAKTIDPSNVYQKKMLPYVNPVKRYFSTNYITFFKQKATVSVKFTWIPAREDREIGLFLSLSLSLLEAVVLAAKSPFPPFPAIFHLFISQNSKGKASVQILEKTKSKV